MRFLSFSILLLLSIVCHGQSKQVHFHVTETFTQQELAFVHIKYLNSEHEILTDISGNATITVPDSTVTLRFSRFLHRVVDIEINPDEFIPDTIDVHLNRYLLFHELPVSKGPVIEVIKNTIAASKHHSIHHITNIEYSTYSKLHIGFGDNQKANEWIRRLNKKGITHTQEFVDDQYLYVTEATTLRQIYNDINQTEWVNGLNTSGVRLPGVALSGTHLQMFNIYSDFITFNGKEYISPLAQYHSINRYNYEIVDTLMLPEGLSYVVAFCPKRIKNFSALKGILYIRVKDHAVVQVIAYPAFNKKGIVEIAIDYQIVGNRLLPERQRLYMKGNQNVAGLMPTIVSDVWYYDYKDHQHYRNKDFDERVLSYYDEEAYTKDSIFWESARREPLTVTEGNTYKYFNENLNTLVLQKTLNLGQNIYFGKLPIGFINFDLNKFLNHNRVEGTRIGIGGETNHKLSDKYKISGFFGYGTEDREVKFGLGYEYYFLEDYRFAIGAKYTRDLQEAGKSYYSFLTYQYSTESIRRLAVGTMDFTDRYEIYIKSHPLTYFDVEFNVSRSINHLRYNYVFDGLGYGVIDITEAKLDFRWAYGERELDFNDEHIKLTSHKPIVYLSLTKNIPSAQNPFDYSRIEARVDQKFRILELGKTGVSFQGGVISGTTPYNRLFVGHGSRNAAGVVVHNSFETMGYNEFAADQFGAIYLSHDFGRMYYRSSFFMPSIMVVYNVGWGSIRHPEEHKWVEVKSYEKGYKEAGVFVNNIVLVKLSGLKAGIGGGVFVRYGEYKLPTASDNILFKFSVYLNPTG
ncbi:MAG: DUF5686 family protein [Cytophagaceae bacterium]